MTDEFAFHVLTWLPANESDELEKETLSSLRIVAPGGITLTEVQDTLAAHTVRDHINVPAALLAEWLLVNWWRLRWEPQHEERPSREWVGAHSMASIGDGYAWPALSFSSDGESIRLRLDADLSARASTIRFLSGSEVDVRPSDFEQAVDRFVSEVEGRVAARILGNRDLSQLREELWDERNDPELAEACRIQALAGRDPGSSPDDWIAQARSFESNAGMAAADEILAVSPTLKGGLSEASETVEAMQNSDVLVRLSWMFDSGHASGSLRAPASPPWVRATEFAKRARDRFGIHAGPISKKALETLLEVHLPLPTVPGANRKLMGGYRNGSGDQTSILAREQREDSQRFYLARLIGAAAVTSTQEHVLAVSKTYTAHQKFQRAFASEFLCPWDELDAFTDEHGTDLDGVDEAANYYQVSPLLVQTTLVNKGKIDRNRLRSSG